MDRTQSSASPIDNLLYDFVSVLHNKAEGLEACEKYLRDAEERNSQSCIEMLNRVIEQDRQMVMELRDHLAEMLQNPQQFEGSQTKQKKGTKQNQQSQQTSAPH